MKTTEAHKARSRLWYSEHKLQARAAMSVWYKVNRDRQRASSAAWRLANPDKVQAMDAARYKANPDKSYEQGLKKRGFTIALFQLAVQRQDGCCAICRVDLSTFHKRAHADHNHLSGRPRGVLCSKCNTGIGLLNDDTERLQAAIHYLLHPTL